MSSTDFNNTEGYERIDSFDEKITKELATNYRDILKHVGEDISREGLDKTPERVAKSMQFLLQGYKTDPVKILKSAMFKEDYRQMVIVKDIEIYSLCEHHLLPFLGKAHVAYIPNGTITGLSKVARVVDVFARRLQVQERLTAEVADCIWEHLQPQGVAVVIEASHSCMTARGVRTPGVGMTTSRMMGTFLEDQRSRKEVLGLMGYG